MSGADLVAGVDLGRLRDPTAVVTLRGDGTITGAHRARLGASWRDTASTVVHLCRGVSLVAVDATGVGDAVCEALEAHGLPVLRVTFTASTKLDLLADLAQVLHGGRLKLSPGCPGATDLEDELRRFVATPTRKGLKLSGKATGKDDLVMGLALAIRALARLRSRES